MKKSIISVILIALIFVFCGAQCDSNKAAYDANNNLNIVHICDMGGNCVDYKVQTWFENQGSGIGFTTEDGNYRGKYKLSAHKIRFEGLQDAVGGLHSRDQRVSAC